MRELWQHAEFREQVFADYQAKRIKAIEEEAYQREIERLAQDKEREQEINNMR